MTVSDDPRIPRRAGQPSKKPANPPKIGKGTMSERRPRAPPYKEQGYTCRFCGAKFVDVRSYHDHIFFCRLKHERKEGGQQ